MKNYFKGHLIPLVPLVLIVLLASFFRLYGLDWDQGQHLHPDERFLTMVVSAMKIPNTFLDYLNPNISTMNPYNLNFGFFVYGTFPLFLTKIVGEIINQKDYWNIHLVGRFLSALFDLGTIILLYKIGKKIFDEKIGLLSSFLYSIMVLPIQLSHFFTVDTFLNFFLVLSFFFLLKILHTRFDREARRAKYLILNTIFLGISFGLALASKISALYFSPIIALVYLFLIIKHFKFTNLLKLLVSGIIFIFVTFIVFRLAQPSAFSSGNFFDWQLNPQLINNINELKAGSSPDTWVPPAVQWKTTAPILFPLKNMVLWGMGLPVGVISVIAVFYVLFVLISCCFNKKSRNNSQFGNLAILNLIIWWILGLFTYQGIQFCKTMRYFLPIYPFFALISASFLTELNRVGCKKFPKVALYLVHFTFYILILVYPVSFMSIYSRPVTRVTASKWIYKNISTNSILTWEHWDDGLPLNLPNNSSSVYQFEELPLFTEDNDEKWQIINPRIEKADYIILSSNRLYGSIPKLPQRYPLTTKYYQSLFDGSLGFDKKIEFTSYPCFPPIGKPFFCFNDDSAEEAFTVYDHPKVMIFQKK